MTPRRALAAGSGGRGAPRRLGERVKVLQSSEVLLPKWEPPRRVGGANVCGLFVRDTKSRVTSARSAFHSSTHTYVTRAPILRSGRFPLLRPWKSSFFPPVQPTRVPLSRRTISFTASLSFIRHLIRPRNLISLNVFAAWRHQRSSSGLGHHNLLFVEYFTLDFP